MGACGGPPWPLPGVSRVLVVPVRSSCVFLVSFHACLGAERLLPCPRFVSHTVMHPLHVRAVEAGERQRGRKPWGTGVWSWDHGGHAVRAGEHALERVGWIRAQAVSHVCGRTFLTWLGPCW